MALDIENLSASVNGHFILKNISFKLLDQASLAIIGPSGSGKTTLVKIILGLGCNLKIFGQISVNGQILQRDDWALPLSERKFAYIPQDLALWPHLTVQKTLELSKRFSKESLLATHDLLDRCGLLEKKNSFPKNLSGGEKQRLALARALVGKPQLLVLDEPFSGLDVVAKTKLIRIIKDLKARFSFGLIHISHDLNECQQLADQFLVLDQGCLFWQGQHLIESSFPKHWNPLSCAISCTHY